jgi:hypothetical protein
VSMPDDPSRVVGAASQFWSLGFAFPNQKIPKECDWFSLDEPIISFMPSLSRPAVVLWKCSENSSRTGIEVEDSYR